MRKYPPVSLLAAEERIRVVKEIFATTYPTYDFLNRLLSLRRDVGWRRAAAARMRFSRTMRLLDVACGTGDLSIQAALLHPGIRATGVDFSMQMLRVGAEKVRRKGLTHRITLERGDARALPYPDSTFDVAAIAFGMRNIPDGISALKEMVRVTVPGGQVIVLEMTFAPSPAFRWLYGLYLLHVLPHLAALFAGNAAAYSYLADSISHFPQPEALSGLMREAGLTHVAYRGLTFGSTFLHIGRRREDS